MLSMRKAMLFVIVLVLAGAGYWHFFEKMPEKQAEPDIVERARVVTIAAAAKKALPITVVANGYVTPFQTVDVRPQVQNVVRAVHVTEGQDVKAGQLLFTLDDRSGRSEVEQAKAQMARDRADLNEAENTLRRNRDLLSKGFVSQAVVDSAQSRVNALRGTLRAAEAAMESSRIAAGYNRIVASIDGRIGAINVYPGSLAQPAGTPMVTIAQLDPVSVTFSLPERELTHLRSTYPSSQAPVIARLPDGTALEGKLAFIDNTADPQSGTIKMKANFANAQRRLWPGSFIIVSLISRTLPEAITVPAQAVVNGPQEKFVYLVKPDMTVQKQHVEVLAIVNEEAAISNVLPGAKVVAEGMEDLRPGGKVRAAGNAGASA